MRRVKTGARWGIVALVLVVSTSVATLAQVVSAGATPAVTPRASGNATAAYQQSITDAVTAIQAYWRREYPDLYGGRYIPVPPARVIAATPGAKLPACQGHKLTYQDAAQNAFYCFDDNFVVYDNAKLFPQLYKDYGGFALALVLAHEWGHAIQDRAGNGNQPTIDQELQADCFAGAWTDQQSNSSSRPVLKPGDLEASLAAMLSFRDQPGTSPDDPSAHGSAFDRISAFQDGFESGPQQCAGYFAKPPLVVELPFSSASEQASGGQVAAKDVIPLSVELLNDFYSKVEPGWVKLDTSSVEAFDSSKPATIPKCGGSKLTVKQVQNRVFYCIDDEYVAFDQPYLQHVFDDIGDFGVTSLIASPFATRAQTIQGEPGVAGNDLADVFQADCYTGGFMAALYNGALDVEASLSPGDLDELIQAFLEYSRARGVSAKVPITFLRMGYIRRGFFSGYQSCDLSTIQDEVKNL